MVRLIADISWRPYLHRVDYLVRRRRFVKVDDRDEAWSYASLITAQT